MAPGDPQSSAALIEALYEGTLDDAAWDRALVAVADSVRASAALLLAFNPSTGEVLREENHRFDTSVLDAYRNYWTYHDCRREAFVALPTGCPATEQTLLIPDWRRSAILNEFLLPVDAPHFMPAWLHKSQSKAVALSLQGTRRRGPFEQRDLDHFRRLLPHIARALEIRDRLQRAQVRAETLARTLDRLTFAVLVLDAAGRLLEANGPAQTLLGCNSGVRRDADGALHLHGEAGRELARWIRSGAPPAGSADGLLHIPRSPGLPLSVVVTPLPTRASAWMSGDPRWLVLIFDPERRVHASAELLARDLGISAREAEVAMLLVAGLDLRDIAARLRVSGHTVRTQVKSVFRKTGLRSQADLIRRVAVGPSMLERH